MSTGPSSSSAAPSDRPGRLPARLLGAALLACLASGVPAAPRAAGAVAVVAHPALPVDEVSLSELRRIFLGDRQFWSGDLRVTLLIPAPGTREREVLLGKIYEKTEAQYRQYWIAKVFRTEAFASPKVVPSSEVAVELVRAIPGSVALMDSTRVPPGVKLLAVEGKRPGDVTYPLR